MYGMGDPRGTMTKTTDHGGLANRTDSATPTTTYGGDTRSTTRVL